MSVGVWGFSVDLIKSFVITSASPIFRIQRWTTLRTFCNLRSSAKRWGSIRTGCKGSPFRDSLIMLLSLNSDWVRSWSLSRVERFTLKKKKEQWSNLNVSIPDPQTELNQTYMQHWDRGARIDISSWECFPNLNTKCGARCDESMNQRCLFTINVASFSPSGIVQVEKESFVPKFGKDLIVVPVHVT